MHATTNSMTHDVSQIPVYTAARDICNLDIDNDNKQQMLSLIACTNTIGR